MQGCIRCKKIAFVLTTFVVGGVEKSFLDLVDSIDKVRYDVTVFLPDDEGEWTSLLKEKCTVKYLKNETFKKIFLTQIQVGKLIGAGRSLLFRLLAKLNYKNNYRKSTEYFVRSMPQIEEKFDCAIAYQIINDDCVLGTLFRIKAEKKAVWSHAYINKEESLYEQWYDQFDKIFCVSAFAQRALVNNFPQLGNKTEIFYNVINPDNMMKLSKEDVSDIMPRSSITITTVGRLSIEKGQEIIPRAARLLINLGYSIRWYLIGEGPLREKIEQSIRDEQVDDNVILLGNKNNPYPYMESCDIYVQTSKVEGWGLTVSEAKVLHKPIVTTDAGVMSEQIQTGVNGIIVREATAEAVVEGIRSLIIDPNLCKAFIQQLCQEDVCHKCELEKLYSFIEA